MGFDFCQRNHALFASVFDGKGRCTARAHGDVDRLDGLFDVVRVEVAPPDDDQVESGYFAARVALTQTVRAASAYLVKGVTKAEAPLLVRLIVRLSARFGMVVP